MIKFIFSKLLKKARFSAIRSSSIHCSSKVESGSSVVCATMGRHSFCGYDCEIYYADIGSFTSIANEVVIGGAMHPMHWVGMSPVFYRGRDSIKKKFSTHPLTAFSKTSIGNDVWIGRSAIVLSGIKVGNGAVIGAGAVVTKNVPNYAVVAGNPARVIRYRFPSDVIAALECIAWWDLDDELISILAKHVMNPERFIAEYQKLMPSETD
jgi:acetyltransferase-like isoleucine patch superfamily enzyme